jgi:hypothetical protein
MLVIPTKRSARGIINLPSGPRLLTAILFEGGKISPESINLRALAWIKAIVRPVRDVLTALEAISWAEGLPRLANFLAPDDWIALSQLLSSLPADVDQQTLKDEPLVHQLLAGDLAWTLAIRLSDASLSRRLEKAGRAALSQGLREILDRQGMVAAGQFGLLRPLLACWTRCRALAAALPNGGWGPQPEQRYQRLVRNALRCSRPDGRPLLADDDLASEPSRSWGRELFDAALESGGEIDRRLAACSLPSLSPDRTAKPTKKAGDLPPASIFCEERGVAVLRRNWNRDDERLAVLFPERRCDLELIASGQVAVSGAWRFEISQQGQSLEPVSDWESNCWYSDVDVDYLEVEIKLSGGVKLQRQIVLAREDRFLLLADSVMSPQRGDLSYRSVLPLAPRVEFRAAAENREGFLMQGRGKSTAAPRPLAQVLPLGMPEWRSEPCCGELKATAGGLELRQASVGQRLFAPLFIDLDRRRFRRRMTWRQLTVAEKLAPVPAETAVGFRVAIGKEQWLIYRALADRSNRTLLGHNLATESLIARFGDDGEVTSIVEIE